MPAVTRELSIVYDTLTIGGGSDSLLLDGEYTLSEGPDQMSLTCSFVVVGTSEADFDAELDAVESALRTPRKRLRVILGAATLYDFNPAVNTGYNCIPNLSKPGDATVDSGRSCRVNASFTMDLPAEKYLQSGRRDSTVQFSKDEADRRHIIVSGEYRADPSGGTSKSAYDSAISSYIASITSLLGGTYDKINEQITYNDTNTILNFTYELLEILFNQNAGTLDDEDIIDPQLSARVVREWPGDTPGGGVQRKVEIEVNYTCAIDAERTKDLVWKYEGGLRTHIFQTAVDGFSSGGSAALLAESFDPDRYSNRITATMRILVVGSGVLSFIKTVTIDDNFGVSLIPVYNGNVFARYKFDGPATRRRTTTTTKTVVGKSSGQKRSSQPNPPGFSINYAAGAGDSGQLRASSVAYIAGAGAEAERRSPGALARRDLALSAKAAAKKRAAGGAAAAAGGTGEWIPISKRISTTPKEMGDDTLCKVTTTDVTEELVEEWAVVVGSPVRQGRRRRGSVGQL